MSRDELMFNYVQFESLILIPALGGIQLDNPGYRLLVAATIAHESKGGTYIKQLIGPALGIAQMEPATHDWLWQAYLPGQSTLTYHLVKLCTYSRPPKATQMINDLLYATAMCAILYKQRLEAHKESPPKTIEEAAICWKKYYSTPGGKGTIEEFIADYNIWTNPSKKKVTKS